MAIWGAALKGIYTLSFSCRGLVICCMSIVQAFCFVSSVLTAPYCFVWMNLSNTKFDCTVDLKAFSCLNKSDSFSFGSLCVLFFSCSQLPSPTNRPTLHFSTNHDKGLLSASYSHTRTCWLGQHRAIYVSVFLLTNTLMCSQQELGIEPPTADPVPTFHTFRKPDGVFEDICAKGFQ